MTPPDIGRRAGLNVITITAATFLIAAAPAGVALAPQIIVQTPPQSAWRIWLPIGVALFSTAIAMTGAWLAWRSQVFGFAKDAAAIARDFRGRQSAAALLAFENSVARPIGMALDLIERMSLDLSRLRPVAAETHLAALETYGAGLIADHSQGLRLCREADAALAEAGRATVFTRAFDNDRLDAKFLAAGDEALSVALPSEASAIDLAIEAVVRTKVSLRRLLEAERSQEAARWLGDLDTDPFFTEVQRWLPRRLRSVKPK